MNRYYIKTHFSDWVEVSKEAFDRYAEHIKKNATGIKASKKDAYIKTVTRVVE